MRLQPRVLGLTLLLITVPLLAWADGGSDEQEQKRLLLEKWKADPEKMARLRANLQAFLALPPERQEQLRRLDQELHDEGSAAAARHHEVLVRYREWLQSLPETDRKNIEDAADAKERLRRIRQLREQEWLARLPRAYRDELAKLPSEKKASRVAELHREENQQREEWRYAVRHWDALLKLERERILRDADAYVQESLMPMLSQEEKVRLARAAGKPNYPRVLVELADKHPIKLPGPSTGPSRFEEMPAEAQKRILLIRKNQPRLAELLRKAEGKWPDYAEFLANATNRSPRPLSRQLGPCRPDEFSPAVQKFIAKELKLGPQQAEALKKAEGQWPNYPQTLLELAKAHNAQIPGMALPGPRELWEPFRAKPRELPEVPQRALQDFMHKSLSAEERAQLPSLSLTDRDTNDKVTEKYFQKNPEELRRLKQADKRMQKNKTR